VPKFERAAKKVAELAGIRDATAQLAIAYVDFAEPLAAIHKPR